MLKRIFERLFGKKQDESVNQKEAAVCTLLCTEGEYKGQVFRLKDGDEMGRHPGCAVCLIEHLSDHMIARRHLCLVYSGEEWVAVCNGMSGTVIDGVLYHGGVDMVPLHTGSTIRIMDYVFEVQ